MDKPHTTNSGWYFWIDRGGTFTDIVARAPDGLLHSLKLLSDNPRHYPDAAAAGIAQLLDSTAQGRNVIEIRMGTTVATNALLERKGARTGLVVTRGFRDLLRIGDQKRPALFDLHIRKPEPLYEVVAEVGGRLNAAGKEIAPLDTQALAATFSDWQQRGIDAIAICLLHAWQDGRHELEVARLAQAAGFKHVHVSHEVSPLINAVSRAATTVADAYLSPVLKKYVAGFQAALRLEQIDCDRVLLMQSNGGLVSAELLRGKDSVLSGPAGGAVAMQALGGKDCAFLGFDMGGTSTDVSVCKGEPELSTATEIGGTTLRSPMIRIHTIAAGGGSILSFDKGRFQVGPASAGATPGPMCYGNGGPLTLTDANFLLGRIQARHFPHVFGPNGDQPIALAPVEKAFRELAAKISAATGQTYSPEQTAAGFLRVGVENMANALRHISVARGLDPARFTLCSFGGAGGQHACQVAERAGIRRILLDPQAGVLSAWGMGQAKLRSYQQQTLNQTLDTATLAENEVVFTALARQCNDNLVTQGIEPARIETRALLDIRATGSDTALTLELDNESAMRAAFAQEHQQRFGFAEDNVELIIDSVRVEASGTSLNWSDAATKTATRIENAAAPTPLEHVTLHFTAGPLSVPVYQRTQLPPGFKLQGPALISESNSTIVVEPDWALTVNATLQIELEQIEIEKVASAQSGTADNLAAEPHDTADPVLLEIINNHFVHIAEEMGAVLRNTARSVNIKERLDFSCALFSHTGDLIANAPHVPVHLGSMDDSVKVALAQHGAALANGAVLLSNAPYNGGTHLPDITVITALTDDASGEINFIVAARAHHADVGGISPGSMPPLSTHIDEEGILFDNFIVVQDGKFREGALRAALQNSQWPARNPDQNIADFRAQIAANERGRQLLAEMVENYGTQLVLAYTDHVQSNAEEAVRQVISKLGEGEFSYELDNGQCICVRVSIDTEQRAALIDFTGTSPAEANNLNAPKAVCQAAVMYVFRTLVDADIPLNAGCRRPLELIVPEGSMLNPNYPAAVVGGNVETSQCVTNALYGALGVLAASQGTMNNLSFGNDQYQYYETICGGTGAGPDFDGADAVQSHMTNTRITDPEIIETRYPVLLHEFSIRAGSGGSGLHSGGNGVVRKIEFLEPMSAAVLSNHRRVMPFGLAGGNPGQTGSNQIERHDGSVESHGSTLASEMQPGDCVIITTPGGGGFGKCRDRQRKERHDI